MFAQGQAFLFSVKIKLCSLPSSGNLLKLKIKSFSSGGRRFVLARFSKLLILKKLVIPARVQVHLEFARFCVSQTCWESGQLPVGFSL